MQRSIASFFKAPAKRPAAGEAGPEEQGAKQRKTPAADAAPAVVAREAGPSAAVVSAAAGTSAALNRSRGFQDFQMLSPAAPASSALSAKEKQQVLNSGVAAATAVAPAALEPPAAVATMLVAGNRCESTQTQPPTTGMATEGRGKEAVGARASSTSSRRAAGMVEMPEMNEYERCGSRVIVII